MNETQKKVIDVSWDQLAIASETLSEWSDPSDVGPLYDGLAKGIKGYPETRFRITIEEVEE